MGMLEDIEQAMKTIDEAPAYAVRFDVSQPVIDRLRESAVPAPLIPAPLWGVSVVLDDTMPPNAFKVINSDGSEKVVVFSL